MAGSGDELHLLPVRYAGCGLRGAYLGVHGDLRRAGHPQDRPVPISGPNSTVLRRILRLYMPCMP